MMDWGIETKLEEDGRVNGPRELVERAAKRAFELASLIKGEARSYLLRVLELWRL
jgi:hypothetical protein